MYKNEYNAKIFQTSKSPRGKRGEGSGLSQLARGAGSFSFDKCSSSPPCTYWCIILKSISILRNNTFSNCASYSPYTYCWCIILSSVWCVQQILHNNTFDRCSSYLHPSPQPTFATLIVESRQNEIAHIVPMTCTLP